MVNNCTLVGRLTRDVKIVGSADYPIAKYGIAVKRGYAKPGKQDTDFFEVTSFGKGAEFVDKFFKKGDVICVIGEIHIDKVDDKYFTNFEAKSQHFVGGKSEHSQESEHLQKEVQIEEDELLPF